MAHALLELLKIILANMDWTRKIKVWLIGLFNGTYMLHKTVPCRLRCTETCDEWLAAIKVAELHWCTEDRGADVDEMHQPIQLKLNISPK